MARGWKTGSGKPGDKHHAIKRASVFWTRSQAFHDVPAATYKAAKGRTDDRSTFLTRTPIFRLRFKGRPQMFSVVRIFICQRRCLAKKLRAIRKPLGSPQSKAGRPHAPHNRPRLDRRLDRLRPRHLGPCRRRHVDLRQFPAGQGQPDLRPASRPGVARSPAACRGAAQRRLLGLSRLRRRPGLQQPPLRRALRTKPDDRRP